MRPHRKEDALNDFCSVIVLFLGGGSGNDDDDDDDEIVTSVFSTTGVK